MDTRLLLAVGVCLMTLASPALAQSSPKPITAPTILDQLAVDTLKEVHNRGADLYNRGEHASSYRMYEGALITVKPFLAHRPSIQKLIATSLEETAKTEGSKIQAYRLHEVIEQVRADLKAEIAKANGGPKTDPVVGETIPAPSEMKPKPIKPAEPPKSEIKPEAPKPETPKAVATGPTGFVEGKVALAGKALANAEVTMVSLDLSRPRIFTGKADATGVYKVVGPLPASKYLIIVTGTNVPMKYTVTETPLRVNLTGGTSLSFDINLE
ncbi:MAG: hypothetical protein ACRC8S_10970 [Fimbriiglobus sp.]